MPSGWLPSGSAKADRTYWVGGARPECHRETHAESADVYVADVKLTGEVTLDRALGVLEADAQIYVAKNAPRHAFVHAGVVSWRGRAVVIPGDSDSGKSTLTAELVKAGAGYLSDEFAVFDRIGQAHPFPRAIWLRSSRTSMGVPTTPESLGGTTTRAVLPVGAIIITRYRRGARWQPVAASPGEGALALFRHAFSVTRAPEFTLGVARAAANSAHVLIGDRGEAHEAATRLLAGVLAW